MKHLYRCNPFLFLIILFFSTEGFSASSNNEQSFESLVKKMKSFKRKTITSGNDTLHLMDYNEDGKVDAEYHYIDGVLFSEKLDLNRDEKWDKSH